jgi:hypothetical protein
MPRPGERLGGPPARASRRQTTHRGLMFVPLEWAAAAGKRPEALFDACTNLRVGTDWRLPQSPAPPYPLRGTGTPPTSSWMLGAGTSGCGTQASRLGSHASAISERLALFRGALPCARQGGDGGGAPCRGDCGFGFRLSFSKIQKKFAAIREPFEYCQRAECEYQEATA